MESKLFLAKGFTIIELIVAVAIIAVLATIITVNIQTYISKSKNAVIRGDMMALVNQSGIYIASRNSYTNFCDDTESQKILDKISSENGGLSLICSSDASAWCATVYLVPIGTVAKNQDPVFCVDSKGVRKEGVHASLYCESNACK